MNWLLAIVATCLTVELFLRLPLVKTTVNIRNVVNKIFRTISSKQISDHWKEVAVPAYAIQLFKNSVLILPIMLLAISPFIVISLYSIKTGLGFHTFIVSLTGLAASTAIGIAYAFIRLKFFNV